MTRSSIFLFCVMLLHTTQAFVNYGNVLPERYSLSSAPVLNTANVYSNQTIVLSPEIPLLTLDYGTESAGFPFFDVSSLSGPTQIEVKYAEQFPALFNPQSDGPWTFTNGLANTFRVQTFNLTATGKTESFMLQGGLRWQTVRLLTSHSVVFSSMGLNSTAAHVPASEVPGRFSTSNTLYNGIWDLGARVAQVACIDAGNAPTTWEVTSEGVFLQGQQTAQSVKGTEFGNYTMSFATKIMRGGTGWRVASGISPYGASFVLTSDYPRDATFIDTNRTLLPPNTVIFNYGWWLVNQSTLETGWNQYFTLDFPVPENKWIDVDTTITTEGYNVTIDGNWIGLIPFFEAEVVGSSSFLGSGSASGGSWGFGPFQDQEAYFKNAKVTAENGTILYQNGLLTDEILSEYSIASLDTSVCLDGAKRDRLIWTGDFYHTSRVIAASTLRYDYVLGTIKRVFAWQRQVEPFKGFININAPMGADPIYKDTDIFLGNYEILIDYQDLFLSAIGNYFANTGDIESLRPYWEQIKALVVARLRYIDPYSGLMAGAEAYYFLGPVNGSAVTALSAYTLGRLVPLAEALGDDGAAILYSDTAANLSRAINSRLWNPSTGVYSLSIDAPSNFSLTAIAWTILSGTANASQAASMISKLPSLRLGIGYKTNSGDADSNTTQLSPNTQGFLLEALFKAQRDLGVQNVTVARTLLNDFWAQMVIQDQYYSGASWEYLFPDGSPGIYLFTSLAHPWGAAPTYVLPEYVLGISPTSPGYKTWAFQPLLQGLELDNVNGTVVTPYGNIEAKWEILNDQVIITVVAPKGTQGVFIASDEAGVECNGHRYSKGDEVPLEGGKRTQVRTKR